MSKNYMEWVTSETPTRWCCDRGNVQDMKKAVDWGFTFGVGNPLLTLKSIHIEKERMAPHIEECKNLKGEEKILELYKRYILPTCEVLMPVFEKTDGKWGRQTVMVNPNKGHDVDYMVEQAIEMYKWAPNLSIKIPVTNAGLIAIEELASKGIHVTGTVGYSVAQGVKVAEAHDRGVKRAKRDGVKPNGANYALFTSRLSQWVAEDAQGSGYTWISEEESVWAGIAVGKRIAHAYVDNGYTDENDLWFVPAGMSKNAPWVAHQFVGGKVLLDGYMPDIEGINEALKDERSQPFSEPVDPDIIDKLMGSPLFRKMYEFDGLSKEEFLTFGPVPHIACSFGTMGFDQIANL